MKNYIVKIVVLSLLLGFASLSAHAQGRVATVDIGKIVDNYWKAKQANAAIKDRQSEMMKDIKGMEDDAKKLKDEYQTLVASAGDPSLSQDERERRKTQSESKLKALRDAQESMTQYDRQARVTLEEQYKRMRDNILTEIRNAVTAKAKSASFSLVLDTSGASITTVPVVLYSNGENDLTDEILKQLNASAPADSIPAPDSKSDSSDKKKK